MRAVARRVEIREAPASIRPMLGQVFVSAGSEYEIQAAVVFDGRLSFQVIDDIGNPSWWPAWLFEVTDCLLPDDWICSAFPGGPVALILGPDFIAGSVDLYAEMVELVPMQVERFWERARRLGLLGE